METTIRLRTDYDVARLKRDLDAALKVRDFEVNGPAVIDGLKYHDGRWKAIGLHALDGRSDAGGLRWAGTNANYQKTAVVKACPYFEEIIDSFKCPVQRVRLLRLEPGAQIGLHSDLGDSFAMRKVRLHIPIVTHEDVDFFVDGRRIAMKEGELWYCDFTKPHRVHNRSSISRVHMVLDLTVDSWLRRQFPPEPIVDRARGWVQYHRYAEEVRLRAMARKVGLHHVKKLVQKVRPPKPKKACANAIPVRTDD